MKGAASIFTHLRKVLAWAFLAFGLLRVAVGVHVESINDSVAQAEAAVRYLGRRSSGQTISRGLYLAFLGGGLGILVEISAHLREAGISRLAN